MSGLLKGSYRPEIKLSWKPYEILIEALALAGPVVGIGLAILYWPALPAVVPQHIGPSGMVDAWNTKQYMALFFVGAALSMYLLMTILSRFPQLFNYPVRITEANAEYMYRLGKNLIQWFKVGTVWVIVTLEFQFFELALGRGTIPFVLMLVLHVVILLGPVVYYVVRMMRPPPTAT